MEKFHSLNGRTQAELERFTARPLCSLCFKGTFSEFQSFTCHKNNLVYRSTAITLYLEWIDLARRYRKSTVSNQNQSQLLKQTVDVVRISWQACWRKSSICTLGFSITKCFISFRQRLEMSKGKTLFMSENDQSGHQCHTPAQNTQDSSQLWPAAKDYYGIFGAQCSKLKKNSS